MCGIFGLIAKSTFVPDFTKAWQDTLYFHCLRGIDALGMIRVDKDGKASAAKDIGWPYSLVDDKKFASLLKKPDDIKFLVSHNRAATRGKKESIAHAHPHLVSKTNGQGYISLVHNGTVHHITDGDKFAGDTDSQQLASMLASGMPLDEFTGRVFGSYALVWYDSEDRGLHFLRNGERPLGFVSSPKAMWFASEPYMVVAAAKRNSLEVTNFATEFPTYEHWVWGLNADEWVQQDKIPLPKSTSYTYYDDDAHYVLPDYNSVEESDPNDEVPWNNGPGKQTQVCPFPASNDSARLIKVIVQGRKVIREFSDGKPIEGEYSGYVAAKAVYDNLYAIHKNKPEIVWVDRGATPPQDALLLSKKYDVHQPAVSTPSTSVVDASSKFRRNSTSLKEKFTEVSEAIGFVAGSNIHFVVTDFTSNGQPDRYRVTGLWCYWDSKNGVWQKSTQIQVMGNVEMKKEDLQTSPYIFSATITELHKSKSTENYWRVFVRAITEDTSAKNPYVSTPSNYNPKVEEVLGESSKSSYDPNDDKRVIKYSQSRTTNSARCDDCGVWYLGSSLFTVSLVEGAYTTATLKLCYQCRNASYADNSHLKNLFNSFIEKRAVISLPGNTTLQ